MSEPRQPPFDPAGELANEAEKPAPGFLSDVWYFLRNNKRWWITPIVIVLLLVGLLVLVGGSAAGPLLYPLF